jgi:hypothetical protein
MTSHRAQPPRKLCVRDVQGAQRSAARQTERKRSPEQPGPQGNAQKAESKTLKSVPKITLERQPLSATRAEPNMRPAPRIGGSRRILIDSGVTQRA